MTSGHVFTDADSECLGSFFRRRTYIVTIVVGELLRSFDPTVSEWGNPPLYEVFNCKKVLLVEFIAVNLGTRGTETSKYPEEYKSTRFRQ